MEERKFISFFGLTRLAVHLDVNHNDHNIEDGHEDNGQNAKQPFEDEFEPALERLAKLTCARREREAVRIVVHHIPDIVVHVHKGLEQIGNDLVSIHDGYCQVDVKGCVGQLINRLLQIRSI